MRGFWAWFILAGAAAGLSGCKTDEAARLSPETDNRAIAVAAAKPAHATAGGPADSRPLVVCFGDSLTAGYGADDGQSYPDFLQGDLDRDGYRYRVVNEGVSGNTTKDGVDRLREVVAMKAAVVVLEFGGNDGLRGLKVETTRANLSDMIVALEGSGAKVVLAGMTLPPEYGADYVGRFTATFPLLAKKFKVPLIPFFLQDVYGRPGMIQADGIHATDKGNEGVARTVVPFVEPLLKR